MILYLQFQIMIFSPKIYQFVAFWVNEFGSVMSTQSMPLTVLLFLYEMGSSIIINKKTLNDK
jgi:hypothetical protein